MSNVEPKKCPQCGAPVDAIAVTCKFCGAEFTAQPQYQASQVPQYAPPQVQHYSQPQVPPEYIYTKSKTTAGILGILLGGLGAHKFYLGKTGWGIIYLLFCWTYVPSIVGIFEGIIYLTSSDEKFYYKYVKK